MRVIYMGSPDFSVYALEALADSSHEVVAAVSRVDKIKGRKKQLQPTDVKKKAMELQIPVYTPENVNDAIFLNELKALNADIIVVSAFGRILKKELLQLLPYGAVNIHGSLLPAYRGASPINAVLAKGEKETGITIMVMSEGLDEGDIIKKQALTIGENETYDELKKRMGILGGEMIVDCLDLIEKNQATRTPQDNAKASYCTLLTRADERIDWRRKGQDIHNQIRSLAKEPGAFTYLEQKPFKIIETTFTAEEQGETAGAVLAFDKKNGVAVAAKGGTLWLKTVKPQGKKEMPAADWYRGLHNKDNIVFTTNEA